MEDKNHKTISMGSILDDDKELDMALERELEIAENREDEEEETVSSEKDLNMTDEESSDYMDEDEEDEEDEVSSSLKNSFSIVDEDESSDDNELKDETSDSDKKLIFVKTQLLKIQNQVNQMIGYLDGLNIPTEKTIEARVDLHNLKESEDENGQQVVEGVFTGEEMIGPDGKKYSVPSNYISKSKLLEGDILKLIIKRNGTFVYKQIGPVERKRLIGTLIKNDTNGQFYVMVDGERWQVIKAAVTFYKGDVGDEAIILVPVDAKSKWAAIENIIKKF